VTLAELNVLPAPAFVASLGGIFEHSPWVAEGVAAARPFATAQQLLDAMRKVVAQSGSAAQMRLILAHPRLGNRGPKPQMLTAASTQEQRRAGLEACTDEQYAQLEQLNRAYFEKFGFPFIRGRCGKRAGRGAAADRADCRLPAG
jgi:2-oxo-4-hydroxy-4-carboxy-5-ureidoimidazoline decarboxylase